MPAAGTAGAKLKSVYLLGRDELTRAIGVCLANGWTGAEPPGHLTSWRQEGDSGGREEGALVS